MPVRRTRKIHKRPKKINRPVVCFFGIDSNTKRKTLSRKFSDLTHYLYDNDQNVPSIMDEHNPDVLVSIGDSWENFPTLSNLPLDIRKKWIHFPLAKDVQHSNILYCYNSTQNPETTANDA
jgi:hypothetical protein